MIYLLSPVKNSLVYFNLWISIDAKTSNWNQCKLCEFKWWWFVSKPQNDRKEILDKSIDHKTWWEAAKMKLGTTNKNLITSSGIWHTETQENWGWISVPIPNVCQNNTGKVQTARYLCLSNSNSNTKALTPHLMVFGDWLWEVMRIKWS